MPEAETIVGTHFRRRHFAPHGRPLERIGVEGSRKLTRCMHAWQGFTTPFEAHAIEAGD